MASVSTINSTNPNIYSIEEPKKSTIWTNAKIKQIALYIFAILLIGAAIAACLLIPAPYTFLPTTIALPVLGMTHSANQIKDYENPKKLKDYKAEAMAMTFGQLYEEFGLKNTFRHQLLTLEQVKEKFNNQIQEMDFSSVNKAFRLDDLATFQIASPEHVTLLRKLNAEEIRARATYESADPSKKGAARARFHRTMNSLEVEYNLFKELQNIA